MRPAQIRSSCIWPTSRQLTLPPKTCWRLAYFASRALAFSVSSVCGLHLVQTLQLVWPGQVNAVSASADALALRKPVMFVHVHKSGGTSLIRRAKAMGERFVAPNSWGGSSQFLDYAPPAGMAHDYQLWRFTNTTCADRVAMFNGQSMPYHWGELHQTNIFSFVSEKKPTFNPIERQLEKGDVCPDDFAYFVVLRETTARLESHVNWEGPSNFRAILDCWEEATASQSCDRVQLEDASGDNEPFGWGWLAFDNYIVRTLGGSETMSLPIGGVNETHLSNAIEMLSKFDLVLPLEEVNTERGRADMDRVLGWHLDPEEKRALAKRHAIHFADEDKARFQSMNKLDIALYDHFVQAYKSAKSEPHSKYTALSRGGGVVFS